MTEQWAVPRLLDRLDEIDTGWLEAVLRQAGHAADVRAFRLIPIGAGNVSDTVRLELDLDGEGPTSLVVKFHPADQGAHAHGVGSGAYRREIGAYRLFAGHPEGCRTPRIVWIDGHAGAINLVMEDLTRSTRAGDQISGCSAEDAAAVVSQLARLHRAFPLPSEAVAPDWAIRMASEGDYWSPLVARAVPIISERFADGLTAADLALVGRAAKLTHGWHNLRHSRLAITHGDPRVDNILFDESRDPADAIIIDWQVTGVRNPMHDIGYFLSGSLSVEDRRHHERDLLRLYGDMFTGPATYAQQALLDDYRVQLVSGLMTTAAAVALLPDNPAVNRLLLTLLVRNCAAVADWDSLSAIEARV